MNARVVTLALLACCICLAGTALAASPNPREIAGFRLGADIASYGSKVLPGNPEVELARRYLSTVALSVPAGFRSGYATYGNCQRPGSVVRLKLNYADDSKAFHEKLLEALKARYGAPKQWRGNPFGSLKVWKWSFQDAELGTVSLILEYYSGEDDAFTKGNSIRLSATGRSTQERDCWLASRPAQPEKPDSPLPDLEAGLPR